MALTVVLAALAAGPAAPGIARAHPGDLDDYGGHFDEQTGVYHYHQPRWNVSRRTREYLNWVEEGRIGELRGIVTRIDRPDAFWIHIPYRPAYQNLVYHVAATNRDDRKAEIKVWYDYVSPELSAQTEGDEYMAWFRKKVVYELDRKLRGQEVTVQFSILPRAGRMKGLVLQGEETINLWLVLNGWSYTLLEAEDNPHAKAFQEAEQIARREKAGLWGR